MNNRNYENYYNIGLLDDIHNYFPDILYSTRFNENPLVDYIQERTEELFNLYSSARRRHRTNNVILQQPQQQQPQQPQQLQPRDTIRVTYSMNEDYDSQLPPSQNDDLLNPLVTLLTAALAPQTTNLMFPNIRRQTFMEPVIVRPTEQEIIDGSSIVEVTNNSEVCAICQETLSQDGRNVRRLNHCHHMFHDNCIRTWFNRNTRCPTCRHDIRE